METNQEHNENPYVAVVSRKVRNLKKKYDRVIQLETQMKEGKKTLNEEQLILVGSRSSLEKALAELESIKKQLEEVAAEQEKAKSSQVVVVEKEIGGPSNQTEMIDSSTFTHEVELVANSTQYEQESNPQSSISPPSDKPNSQIVQDSEILRGHLHKILKLFHVCSRYSVLSGGIALPADINYFGKCLLGETSIDCFSKALNQSVRNAELYLDMEMGSKYEAIRGMSYCQIAEIIDSLADQLPLPASPLPPRVPSPPPQSPQINFFADGGLVDESDPHYQESYNAPIGSFGATASPFPLPPSAVVMYDQWHSTEPSPPLSPSTLAASALGGVIGSGAVASAGAGAGASTSGSSEVTHQVVEQVVAATESQDETTENQAKEHSGKKGRGQSRGGRGGKGRGRGRGKENVNQGDGDTQHEVKESSVANADPAAEPKVGISWGGQQKKAGGALAAVSGATETNDVSTPDSEGGRGPNRARRGRGNGRGGASGGRGGSNGSGNEGSSPAATSQAVTTPSATNSTGEGELNGRGRGSGNGGRGRGGPRTEGGRGSPRTEGGRSGPRPDGGRGGSRTEGGRGRGGGRSQSSQKPSTAPSAAAPPPPVAV